MTDYVERIDSSAVAMRSVAAALCGQFLRVYEGTAFEEVLARMVARFGPRVSSWAIEQVIRGSGTALAVAERVRSADLARWAVSLYEGLDGHFDAVIVGAPNGGVANLAVALGAPFLSEHFVSAFRVQAYVDDIAAHKSQGDAVAQAILAHNPDLHVIQHYDPLHDRFLVKYVNHIRMKLLDLPEEYQTFVRERLRPGGTLVFVDCRYPWRQYRVGERHAFQVGGLGAVTDDEFIAGNSQIAAMQRAERSPFVGGWSLKGLPLAVQPESEWGTLPEFRAAVEGFAQKNGYRFLALVANHPEWYAELAFRANVRLFEEKTMEPQGVLVECFTQANPIAARQSGLLPLWLPWNCTDSLPFLRRMAAEFPSGKPVIFTPLANFTRTFDLATLEQYRDILRGFPLILQGMDPRLYPADPTSLFRTARELERWCAAHPAPMQAHLTAEELAICAQEMGNRFALSTNSQRINE